MMDENGPEDSGGKILDSLFYLPCPLGRVTSKSTMPSSPPPSKKKWMIRQVLFALWAVLVAMGLIALYCAGSDLLTICLVPIASLAYFLLDLALVVGLFLLRNLCLYFMGISLSASVAYSGSSGGDDYWAVVEYVSSNSVSTTSTQTNSDCLPIERETDVSMDHESLMREQLICRKRLDISRSEYGTGVSKTVNILMFPKDPKTAISLGVWKRDIGFLTSLLAVTLLQGFLCLIPVIQYTPSQQQPLESFLYNALPRIIVIPLFVPVADSILNDIARTRQREEFSASSSIRTLSIHAPV
jgi:hypothetical protein